MNLFGLRFSCWSATTNGGTMDSRLHSRTRVNQKNNRVLVGDIAATSLTLVIFGVDAMGTTPNPRHRVSARIGSGCDLVHRTGRRVSHSHGPVGREITRHRLGILDRRTGCRATGWGRRVGSLTSVPPYHWARPGCAAPRGLATGDVDGQRCCDRPRR